MKNRYKILESLPPYGPMYMPISVDGKEFYSEGFVVRFYKSDDTEWVGNFYPGGTTLREVVELHDTTNLLIIADGTCYIMNPESSVPLMAFGGDYLNIFKANRNKFVLQDSVGLTIIEPDGTYWDSERISWDGLADVTIENNTVIGISYDPMYDADEWVYFSYDIDSKKLIGGSFNKESESRPKRPWWRLW